MKLYLITPPLLSLLSSLLLFESTRIQQNPACFSNNTYLPSLLCSIPVASTGALAPFSI